METRLAELY